MNEEIINSAVIENSVSLLTDFFSVISDGYNPTIIDISFDLNNNVDLKKIFVLASHFGSDTKGLYFASIFNTKKQVFNISDKIDESFEWCFNHLSLFNKAPEIFKSEFHLNNLLDLIKKIKVQILKFIENWNAVANEYIVDTRNGSLRRVLIIDTKDKSLVLDFGNYIH